ncbi:hypothetical protein SAMN05444170_0105 [Bradyrhizobium erythrophlei]|uniref:Uncharacterized protein n=1 Tax=Bradyrhizobium erythrophlei TaxID=1437360 RepID=A0A1M7SSD1_9BRAD|nr:hypothetical protein SAMN05444170_0105 [Bradyrhizobium erythrophlei]
MTGKVPVFMQIAWFDLHLLLHAAGPVRPPLSKCTAVLHRELHRPSRCVHVVAS